MRRRLATLWRVSIGTPPRRRCSLLICLLRRPTGVCALEDALAIGVMHLQAGSLRHFSLLYSYCLSALWSTHCRLEQVRCVNRPAGDSWKCLLLFLVLRVIGADRRKERKDVAFFPFP